MLVLRETAQNGVHRTENLQMLKPTFIDQHGRVLSAEHKLPCRTIMTFCCAFRTSALLARVTPNA